MAVQYGDV